MADLKALAELVRQGERVLDHQVQQSDAQDEKSRQVLNFVAGLFGAAAAGSTLLAGVADLDAGWMVAPFVVLVAAGVALAARAFHLSAEAYLGAAGADKLIVGWDTATLQASAQEGDGLEDVLRSSLNGMEGWIAFNLESQRTAKRKRVLSYRWLFAGGACLVVAYMYAAALAMV